MSNTLHLGLLEAVCTNATLMHSFFNMACIAGSAICPLMPAYAAGQDKPRAGGWEKQVWWQWAKC